MLITAVFKRDSHTSDLALRQAASKYRIAGTGSIGQAASSAASSTLPSSGAASLTQMEAAILAIYSAAIGLGFTDAQSQAIAKAAAIAYAGAINQGLTPAQAAQAAAAAATQVAMSYDNGTGSGGLMGFMEDMMIYSAAFGAVLSQLPTSSQGAGEDALLAFLQALGW